MDPLTGPKRILVVDREAHIRRLIEIHLERAGYEPLLAENSDVGLSLVSRSPCLLLAPVMLVPLDGFAFLRAVREQEGFERIPAILMGAVRNLACEDDPPDFNPEREMRESVERTFGRCDYLVRPFNPQEMVHRVEALLRRV